MEDRPFAIKVLGPDQLEKPSSHQARSAANTLTFSNCGMAPFAKVPRAGRTWQPAPGGFGEGAEQLRDGNMVGLAYRLPVHGKEGWYSGPKISKMAGIDTDQAEMFVPDAKGAMGHRPRGPLFMRSILERTDGSLVAYMVLFKRHRPVYGRGRPTSGYVANRPAAAALGTI